LFPGIKATDGWRTPLVSKHTIGYIHALMIDSVTALSTEPPKARALRNENMVVEELKMNKDDFRSELRDCLVDYYENILKMDGAGGISRSCSFKDKLKSISANAATDGEGDAASAAGEAGGSGIEPNPELDADADTANSPTPPPAAPAEAAPASATAEEAAKEAASPPGKGGEGKGAKTN
jgi:hypothetical protein